MAEIEFILMYIIGGLVILVLFFFLALQRKEILKLVESNEGVLSMLNISQKKGAAGENMMMAVSDALIQAGIMEKDVHLPDGLEMDFAAVLDNGDDGGRIYIPIDSKVNKPPIKVIEEISKYIGKTYGNGVRTTSFAIVGYPDGEEQKYMEKRAKAREQSVFFVKVSELPVYINFTCWYHDNIAPLESAGADIAKALIVFKNHYTEVEKQVYAVQQKLNKLVDTVKFAPVGENLRRALVLVESTSDESQSGEDSEPSNDSEPTDKDEIESTFALPDDLPFAKFKVSGLGKKKELLEEYRTVGEIRGLSRYDLVEKGLTEALADKVHSELNRKTNSTDLSESDGSV
jgi:hypothetical protein